MADRPQDRGKGIDRCAKIDHIALIEVATMITQTMVQPSSWIDSGIQIQQVRGLNLFKFTAVIALTPIASHKPRYTSGKGWGRSMR
jgi:hypothetical protein